MSNYLMVLATPCYDVAPGRFAAESAFCVHLREMKRKLAPRFTHLTVAGPRMSRAQYEKSGPYLLELDDEKDGISFVPLFDDDVGPSRFWLKEALPTLAKLASEVQDADLVHAGTSHNLSRPFEFPSLAIAALLGKKTISVSDIDLRNQAKMSYESGRWRLHSYLLARLVYDPVRVLQIRAVVRMCSLVLLKGSKFVRDFGGPGRPHVRDFLDAAYEVDDVMSDARLEEKVRELEDPDLPLSVIYFGRFTPYKGADRCIRAVRQARDMGRKVHLTLMGFGEQAAELKRLVEELGLEDITTFAPPVPYGPLFFEKLFPHHLSLAAPLSEDTARTAMDSMASGMPLIAFDTYYYRDLLPSGAVDLVGWDDVTAMAERIAWYAEDKKRLIPLARNAVKFARENTQEVWLGKRVRWTLDLFPDDR